MKKILYCKYNQSRAEEYQMKTVIYEQQGIRYVEKVPLGKKSQRHLEQFYQNYHKLKNQYTHIRYVPPEKTDTGIRFPYIQGKTLDDLLHPHICQGERLFERLRTLLAEVYQTAPGQTCSFQMNEHYREWFGAEDCTKELCIAPANVDLIFSNIIQTEDGTYQAFDYEWAFDMALPKEFVVFRALHHFYIQYVRKLSKMYTLDQFLGKCGIEVNMCRKYERMESQMYRKICQGAEVDVQNFYEAARIDFAAVSQERQLLKENVEQLQQQLQQAKQECVDLKAENSVLEQKNMKMLQSSSWRVTRPLRQLKEALPSLYPYRLIGNKRAGVQTSQHFLQNFPQKAHIVTRAELKRQKKERFFYEPKISIVTPLFHTPEKFLTEMLDSVCAQTYSKWELCLYDCSGKEHDRVGAVCQKYMQHEKRILYKKGKNQGIAVNTNRCIAMSSGEYIGILDHDDVLHPSALYEVVKAVQKTNSDFIYTDEIKFKHEITRSFAPNFKPDFAREELYVHNYICHFNVYKRSLYEQTQGYRKEYDGSQDHDMVLRLTQKAERIVHIPKILYYWRVHSDSVAFNSNVKSYASDAGRRAVEDEQRRMGSAVYVKSVRNNIPCYRMYFQEKNQQELTVVIWGAKNRTQVHTCIRSLAKSENHAVRYVVIEDAYAEEELFDSCDYTCLERKGRTEGQLWNLVMDRYVDQYALFIHASLKVLTDAVYQEMFLYLTQEKVACADACIILNDRILSGGMALGYSKDRDLRKYKCRGNGFGVGSNGYEDYLIHTRNVLTVTGCCSGISKAAWISMHGFLSVSYPAVSFGVRASRSGYENVWTPFVIADGDLSKQINEIEDLTPPHGFVDPYYNPNIEKYGLDETV